MQPLPIDPHVPLALERVRQHSSLIVTAAPGTGKTTRLPIAIARDRHLEGQVWVLEPRRVATRMAALRVAQENKIELGRQVGYAVRHEQRHRPDSKLIYMTQGLFVRRLLANPELRGVACVVLDEFHERHVDGDLALSVLRCLQRAARPELRVVVLSATLDPKPLLAFLPDAEHLHVDAPHHAVEIEHLPRSDDRPLEKKVAGALDRLWRQQQTGDALVFLPGAASIERCRRLLAPRCEARGIDLRRLHGDMSADDQMLSLRRGPRPAVVLSTNIAESSLTIAGVTTVIDSGLAKIAGHHAWSGLPTLKTQPVAQDSCQQRAGRAGRLGPGRCLRLYTQADYQQRPAAQPPEILRSDICGLLLAIAHLQNELGVDELSWLTAPPEAAVQNARELLGRLGALEPRGGLSERGHKLLGYPVHPRLGMLIEEGRARGVSALACAAATVLDQDRRPRLWAEPASQVLDCDLRPEIDALLGDGTRKSHVGVSMRKSLAQLERLAGSTNKTKEVQDPWRRLRLCLLAAFADRVCARSPEGRGLVLAQGGQAQLADSSAVSDAPLLVALHAVQARRGTRGGARVLLASAIEADWLLDLFVDDIEDREAVEMLAPKGCVVWRRQLRFGQIVIDEDSRDARGSEAAVELLLDALLRRGVEALPGAQEIRSLARRVALCKQLRPEIKTGALDLHDLRQALRPLAASCASLAELCSQDLPAAIHAGLGGPLRASLMDLTPTRLRLRNGQALPVAYPDDADPLLRGYIQDFFCLPTSPLLARGRIHLRLELQAPNRRAVQITTDLQSFWEQHYPGLKKQLSRRYPRHHWPEDPTHAPPVLLKRQLSRTKTGQ